MKKIKDPVSGFTHLTWGFLSIAGLVFLIIASAYSDEPGFNVVSCTIFGVSLILLYFCSANYHLFKASDKVTTLLRKLDHIMIYFLIAGTYTPVCLGPLRGPWGWSIFGVVWFLAIAGLFLTIFWINAPRWLTTSIYLAMGWIVIIAIYPMVTIFAESNALGSLWWLVLGGICYTIGGVLYGLKWPKLKNKYFGFHEIFHIFIMLGSLFHFWFIYRYVLYI